MASQCYFGKKVMRKRRNVCNTPWWMNLFATPFHLRQPSSRRCISRPRKRHHSGTCASYPATLVKLRFSDSEPEHSLSEEGPCLSSCTCTFAPFFPLESCNWRDAIGLHSFKQGDIVLSHNNTTRGWAVGIL